MWWVNQFIGWYKRKGYSVIVEDSVICQFKGVFRQLKVKEV